MSPTSHTRTPWHVHLVDNTAVIDAAGDAVATMCGDYEDEQTGLLMEQRAAFIVRACNSHETMLAELKALRRRFHAACMHVGNSADVANDACTSADAAIAAAEPQS